MLITFEKREIILEDGTRISVLVPIDPFSKKEIDCETLEPIRE